MANNQAGKNEPDHVYVVTDRPIFGHSTPAADDAAGRDTGQCGVRFS